MTIAHRGAVSLILQKATVCTNNSVMLFAFVWFLGDNIQQTVSFEKFRKENKLISCRLTDALFSEKVPSSFAENGIMPGSKSNHGKCLCAVSHPLPLLSVVVAAAPTLPAHSNMLNSCKVLYVWKGCLQMHAPEGGGKRKKVDLRTCFLLTK